jgi:hypothetical protein
MSREVCHGTVLVLGGNFARAPFSLKPQVMDSLHIVITGFSASLAAGLATGLGSAGAMLFIINDEIIPETHRRGFENLATFCLLIGFVCMMFLDATLG